MKIAVIGGGSTYTPEVVEGFVGRAGDLGLAEVALMDIDPARLEVVGTFSRRMVAHAGSPFRLTTTADRRAAIDGASFVLTQVRVGGQAARHQDILLGLRHGLIGQETTGIGGMAKALRTVPVILDLCREIERTAPDAWVINFTNPSGLITQAILDHSACRCIGLCNIPIEMKMLVAAYLGVPESDVRLDIVGLNHLGWVRKVFVRGEDATPGLLAFLTSADGPKNIPDVDFPPELIRALDAVPLGYNRYYYMTDKLLAELRAKPRTRAEEVMDIEDELLAKYRDPAVVTKPPELGKRGGAFYSKIAVDLVDAIANDRGAEHVVNLRNAGAIPDLPARAVVETAAHVGKGGATPVPTGPLEPSIRALIQRAKAYEELTIEAAVTRSRSAAYRALITNPLGPTATAASEVLDDLLATNRLDYA
jgi:6-phospho-beta-glucosidase